MNTVALHHAVDGPEAGPPLVLGGSLGTSLVWRPQLPALAAGHRVVRYDHRGHGGSVEQAGAVDRLLLGWFGDRKAGSG